MKRSVEIWEEYLELISSEHATHGDIMGKVQQMNRLCHRLEVALEIKNAELRSLKVILNQCLMGIYYNEPFPEDLDDYIAGVPCPNNPVTQAIEGKA